VASIGSLALLHVAGHVASADDFRDQPEVLDGASRLFAEVLLERGSHSRTAYPSPRLPKNISIELEITFAYALTA
jgi:enamine deaminase RidA (YjgF/YER057c/UK114 family)